MNDQFLPDGHAAKEDYEVSPEGPGKGAANFSAKAQQENFLAGGGNAEGEPPKTPTEASKGFLNKIKEKALNNKFKVLTHAVGTGILVDAVVDVGHGNYGALLAKALWGHFQLRFLMQEKVDGNDK